MLLAPDARVQSVEMQQVIIRNDDTETPDLLWRTISISNIRYLRELPVILCD